MEYKRKLTLLVEETLSERAKKLGLNISGYLEALLVNFIANSNRFTVNGNNHRPTNLGKICEGWDSNPRTPTRQNLKSCTVGQALLPSQLIGLYSGNILKVLKFDD